MAKEFTTSSRQQLYQVVHFCFVRNQESCRLTVALDVDAIYLHIIKVVTAYITSDNQDHAVENYLS